MLLFDENLAARLVPELADLSPTCSMACAKPVGAPIAKRRNGIRILALSLWKNSAAAHFTVTPPKAGAHRAVARTAQDW
jgi:hypothetical protein